MLLKIFNNRCRRIIPRILICAIDNRCLQSRGMIEFGKTFIGDVNV